MPGPSGISGKTIGLIGACLLALVFVVVVWVSASSAPPSGGKNNDLFPTDPSEIPNIEDTQTGGAMLVTMVDKNDPTRVAGTLRADRFEPIGQGRRRLDNPESWIFLSDGRSLRITADSATMLMPEPDQPPESGMLEGNIEIHAYETSPRPGEALPAGARPSMVARFDEPVEFERRYLRLHSGGHFDITSAQFDFSGTDLTIVLNDLRDRVERIDVVRGDRLVIHTGAEQEADDAGSNASADDPGEGTNPPQTVGQPTPLDGQTPPPAAAEPTRYHIALRDEVVASVAGSGRAATDSLELWAALTDGALAPDAIRDIAFAPSQDSEQQDTTREVPETGPGSDVQEQPASQTQPGGAARDVGRDLTITWTGAMSVRPIDDAVPDELRDDQFTLRLAADEGRGTRFDLPERGFTGQATRATYYATRGVVDMKGERTEERIIRLASADSGTLVTESLRADLTTGVITIDGRGQITTSVTDPRQAASIQWKNRAAFTFAMRDGSFSDRLREAVFEGAAIARQGDASAGARLLRATLDPDLPSQRALTRLAMTEGVLSGGDQSLLSGKQLTIDFVPGSGDSGVDPVRVDAVGQALGRTSEAMLRARALSATLMRDLTGDIVMRTADADGSVSYRGADRTSASAEHLSADGVAQTVTLTGDGARVAQGGSTITGADITLDQRRRTLKVAGPGGFDHDIALDDADPGAPVAGHIRTTWEGSMRFDDALGSVVADGGVRVISTPDAYTRDTLTASRAQIKLSPLPATNPVGADANALPRERELLWARVYGHAPATENPVPATIESRTYSRTNPELALSVLYLEGPQILADNTAQTLTVPAPGTLLILDRTGGPDDATAPQAASPITSGGPGLTRFTWQGRMVLDRARGTADFAKQVIVDQKSLTTGKIAHLGADALTARFDIGDQELAQATRLLSATAMGAVRFVYEGRELLADRASYDAVADSLFASALENKRVTLYNDASSPPTAAKTMRWDLTNDRIEINAPAPIHMPTGTGG